MQNLMIDRAALTLGNVELKRHEREKTCQIKINQLPRSKSQCSCIALMIQLMAVCGYTHPPWF